MKNKKFIIIYIFVLNLFDLCSTYYGIVKGYISEANPIMNFMYETNPLIFVFFKLIIISIALIFIYKHFNKNKYLNLILYVPAVMYTYIAFLHIFYFVCAFKLGFI